MRKVIKPPGPPAPADDQLFFKIGFCLVTLFVLYLLLDWGK